MGTYDVFITEDNKELQLKNGDCCLYSFKIGSKVTKYGYGDGIYYDPISEYFVVVNKGIFIATFKKSQIKDKWGNFLEMIVFSYE